MNCRCFSACVAAEKWPGLCPRGALEGAGNGQRELAVGLLQGRAQPAVLPSMLKGRVAQVYQFSWFLPLDFHAG